MLLAIDVGNTNIVMGIYDNKRLIYDWRISTIKDTTEDEFNILTKNLFTDRGIHTKQVKKTIISCVVPPFIEILDKFCRKYLGHAPFWVDITSVSAMPILYKNPSEVGSDRIVNAIGAYNKYKTNLIVIDFGTATTFDAISEKGEYLGGAISPGIMIASESLFMNASKLPRVAMFTPPPKRVIGKDTIESIKAGIVYGYAGLVDGMVKKMKTEMASKPTVIATGGLAELMYKFTKDIDAVEPALTLEGLRIIGSTYL
mmetsp:Transcript_6430/g.3640  ORF Transcript_6430/g.3640 Transcript_6430/m.3640 type:complete len:257 (-) Transcript_6430:407-1177(-)